MSRTGSHYQSSVPRWQTLIGANSLKSSLYTNWALAATILSIAVTGCGTAAYEKRMSESVSARRIVVSKNRAKEAKDKNNPDQPAAGQPVPAQAAPAQPAPAQPAAPAGS